MSMFNWAHYIKSKIGSAVQSVVARITDIKDAIKSALDRLRNVLGHNFEHVPRILVHSAEEACARVKANPCKTALILVCVVGIVAPVIFRRSGAGFGAGGVAAAMLCC